MFCKSRYAHLSDCISVTIYGTDCKIKGKECHATVCMWYEHGVPQLCYHLQDSPEGLLELAEYLRNRCAYPEDETCSTE